MVRPPNVVRAPFLDVVLSFIQGQSTVVVPTGRCPQSIVGSNGWNQECITPSTFSILDI